MTTNTKLLFLIILIVTAVILFINCSPAPMIQSAHVNFGVKTGVNVTGSDKHDEDFNPYYLAIGIKNRVELTASVYPFYPILVAGASANMKVFLFEHGNNGLFKNISTAVFSGGKTASGERETCSSANAGMIVSTFHKTDKLDLELIFQPSYFRLKRTRSIDDGFGVEDNDKVDGLNLNCGTIINIDPNRDNRFSTGIRLGAGYQIALKTQSYRWAMNEGTYNYYPGVSKNNSDYTGWVYELGLDFNWKSRRQMIKG